MDRIKRIKWFDRQANRYERKRNKRELGEWRKRIIPSALGHVLEVAVGAGANFPYYRKNVKITAVDFSPRMLEKAEAAARECGLDAEFVESDVESLTFGPESFDTVVSTLSLCSYDEPLQVLNAFSRWCKRDGRVLLLEHGLSTNAALAFVQKGLDPLACRITGCHHDRNIMQLVESAELDVERWERHWAGVIHLIWAKPKETAYGPHLT